VTDGLAHFNALPEGVAQAELLRCCGSRAWANRMLDERPYVDAAALYAAAERVWWELQRSDWLEAFAVHPRIGASRLDERAAHEQSGMTQATGRVRRAIAEGNEAYERRFGYTYLVCATGRGAAELADDLVRRLCHEPAEELRVAAAEQAKITRLRLEKLVTP
jgi:2-oxo-4-hydroxy-4-carboxy-5-ureidoimidazoline decarboxylase